MPILTAMVKEADCVIVAVQIARRVKDVLREAQELAQSASPQEEVTAAPEVADGMAALHLADSHADSSAAGLAAGSANGNGMADDVIVFEGEQLSLSELAIAQAAEQVPCCFMQIVLSPSYWHDCSVLLSLLVICAINAVDA